MQNKAVAAQGPEEGEEEENRGKEEVEDMGLGWMEACCTALELHAADQAVQVSPLVLNLLKLVTQNPTRVFYDSPPLTGGCELGDPQSVTARSWSQPIRGGAGPEVNITHHLTSRSDIMSKFCNKLCKLCLYIQDSGSQTADGVHAAPPFVS